MFHFEKQKKVFMVHYRLYFEWLIYMTAPKSYKRLESLWVLRWPGVRDKDISLKIKESSPDKREINLTVSSGCR